MVYYWTETWHAGDHHVAAVEERSDASSHHISAQLNWDELGGMN